MKTTEIERIQKHAKKIASGKDPDVKPGQPERLSEAAAVGDFGWQGDLKITVAADVPVGYVRVAKPKESDKQLVPGNTVGAKHCLDSLAGVELWRPAEWNEDSLDGPFLRLSKERTILHPTHGSVTIPAGTCVLLTYQREYDREQKKERRARD